MRSSGRYRERCLMASASWQPCRPGGRDFIPSKMTIWQGRRTGWSPPGPRKARPDDRLRRNPPSWRFITADRDPPYALKKPQVRPSWQCLLVAQPTNRAGLAMSVDRDRSEVARRGSSRRDPQRTFIQSNRCPGAGSTNRFYTSGVSGAALSRDEELPYRGTSRYRDASVSIRSWR
jgi:hypothetical protein